MKSVHVNEPSLVKALAQSIKSMRVTTHIAGNSNKHKVLAGPNVQVVGRYPEFGHWIGCVVCMDGLELELAPQGVDVLLLVVHPSKLHEMIPHSGMSTVGSNHEIESDVDLLGTRILGRAAVLHLKPRLASTIVCARELVVEEELDIGHALENVEKPLVESRTVNGVDCLSGWRQLQILSG